MPNTLDKKISKALALQKEGKSQDAAIIYNKVLRTHPANFHATHMLGVIAAENDNTDAAIELLKKAIKLRPDHAAANFNIAGTYARLGLKDEAEKHFLQAIRLKPDYGEAYQGLTDSIKFEEEPDFLHTLEEQCTNNKLDSNTRCYLHFAAGKIHNDLKNYDGAFTHYIAANKLKGASFNISEHNRIVQQIIDTYTPDLVYRYSDRSSPDPLPVFIVGMPRSGTTLIEHILASHPAIHGAGELKDIGSISATIPKHIANTPSYPECIPQAPYEVISGFAGSYLNRIRNMAPSAQRIIDKQPLNFYHIGLIAELFPNAHIIHAIRDPRDSCLSCYFQNFTQGQPYSFDLTNLGAFFNSYKKLMAHWKSIVPNMIFEVNYEDMVSNRESVTREILNFIGVEWHDDCNRHQHTERIITTASRWQVRQAIYTSSVQRWKKYEQHLGPLLDILEL